MVGHSRSLLSAERLILWRNANLVEKKVTSTTAERLLWGNISTFKVKFKLSIVSKNLEKRSLFVFTSSCIEYLIGATYAGINSHPEIWNIFKISFTSGQATIIDRSHSTSP